ncbi:glycoside hydrolase family 20 protein [uncultured Parabacteroides sp.]|uniref:glycoside hydrolase family 20 protein n=1 Tax=uncultured Parabacteroides sp. TaxID=512312 RepID=UPI0025D6F3DD|nr:glycoside hydrolase family 20 protein [uncultured Parabacteroides sp.]
MNKLTKYVCILTAIAGAVACSDGQKAQGDYAVIPLPQEVAIQGSAPFLLKPSTPITYQEGDAEMEQTARFLASYIKDATGYEPKVTTGDTGKGIHLSIASDIRNKEGYRLLVSENGVEIAGASNAGIFYGVQTLRKSIPAVADGMQVELPAVSINDYPRFPYRGMHLDVSRHFFPTDSVKKFIDILALHNMNRFHWHLTDDQGWRIEIKKYPELTQIGSKRKETVIGRNSGKYDGQPYDGFYTQDEIRDVIAYAKERFITIIPEIDLPGHQLAALATYPELGCTGGPYEVWTQWGVSDDVICAGNEKSMQFLEDVLAEVIDLFPSEYIHIGGDECPKVRWQKCPKCQARIKAEGIKGDSKHSAEEYLQSYVISRMEKFVESKGRHIIGWDEILEGGLAPNATVMSWRGVGGGIEAAKQQHNVIMTPNSYLYFDYYQSTDTEHDPLAIGGYLPLERVYSFEPTDGIPEEYQKYVIGAQANLWTEYIPTFSQVEYMIMPRMDALAEVQWTNAPKDYKAFLPRLVRMTKLYDRLGYNYAKHIFDIRASFATDGDKGEVVVTLETEGDADIHYTLDGSEPNAASPKYEAPLRIKENVEIKAVAIRPTGNSRIFSEKIDFNKATAKPVTLRVAPSKGYDFNGGPELTDGLSGNDNYKTGRWLGFQGKDLDAVIDLKEPTEFSRVSFNTNVVKGDWIMGAAGITVKVSDDGQTFKEVAAKTIPSLGKDDKDGLYPQEITFAPVKARYVEVIIKSDKLPAWHGGAGYPAFLFVDEINIQ